MIDPPARVAAPAARRSTPRWILVALGLLVLLPRCWRLDAVGEGTDEGYSVAATRAILAGRFSYGDLNDFLADGYQAKFCPIAEIAAVPFVAILGDHAYVFRLPSLLASLALAFLLARAAHRRFGGGAAGVVLALYALDYRSVVYAQTHRYVAIEQLLSFLFVAALLRAQQTSRTRDALAAFGTGLLLFHTHLLAVFLMGPAFLALLRRPPSGGGLPRLSKPAWATGVLLVHAAVVLWLFRSMAIGKFFDSGTLSEGLARAAASTTRTLLGLGSGTAILGVFGATMFLFRPTDASSDRAWAICALGPVLVFGLASVRYQLAPRYALTAQPFLMLCAAGFAAPLLAKYGRLAFVGLALIVLPTAGVTGWYLATGGGRDAEAPILAAIASNAARGDGVLYDIPQMDPFGRRPAAYPSVGRRTTLDPEGEKRLDEAHVRFVVRSTLEPTGPIYTPSLLARLEPLASWQPPALLQAPWTITLYRLKAP